MGLSLLIVLLFACNLNLIGQLLVRDLLEGKKFAATAKNMFLGRDTYIKLKTQNTFYLMPLPRKYGG